MQEFNKFACKECQRRKIKCTREVPHCGQCFTNERGCVYEEVHKTPLTRKHLTAVEQELALTKLILTKLFPQFDQTLMISQLESSQGIEDIIDSIKSGELRNLKRQRTGSENELPAADTPQSISNILLSPKAPMTILSLVDGASPELNFRNRFTGENELRAELLPPPISNIEKYFPQKQVGMASSPFSSLSKPFEWDERKLLRHDTRPTIIDGMATTVSNSYLGVTSSAALLHFAGVGYFLNPIKPGLLPSDISTKVERKVLEHSVNGYFETFHISHPIVHKALFFAYFNEIVPPPTCWKSLLYIVAAIGSFTSAKSADDHEDLVFFDRSKQNLSIEDWETGNLTLVQTLGLMSSYLQLRDRPNSGYNYLGMAVRMAMGLGIHKNIDDSGIPLFDQELRRRVWWCLYVFDCGQTITYGRPLGIAYSGVDSRLPLNIVDSSLTSASISSPEEENLPTIYTSVRLQSLFHLLTNPIYEQVISDPFPPALSLLQWDALYIQKWKSLIPDYYQEAADVSLEFKLSHAIIHWRCKNLRIIMFRMFLLTQSSDQKSDAEYEYRWKASVICLEECRATIRNMEQFWSDDRKYTRMDAWYSLYFLVPAVMMPLVCLRNDPGSMDAPYWRDDVVVAQKIIQKITFICPPASRILDLINKVSPGSVSDLIEDDNATFPIPNLAGEDGPITQLMQLHSMLWPDTLLV